MVDSYKIMAAVKSTLQRPNDQVGRPMSIRTVAIVWFVLLVVSLTGAYDYYFGLF